MPRMGRVVLPNYPHHIVQRGHNRQVVFACAEDFQRYLSDMGELKEAFHIKLYAWCLMTNHVHLLCPRKRGRPRPVYEIAGSQSYTLPQSA